MSPRKSVTPPIRDAELFHHEYASTNTSRCEDPDLYPPEIDSTQRFRPTASAIKKRQGYGRSSAPLATERGFVVIARHGDAVGKGPTTFTLLLRVHCGDQWSVVRFGQLMPPICPQLVKR